MSTFEAARPRYTLPFAGKEYELLGTFGLIEAVEYALKANISAIAVRVVKDMPVSDLAKVISAILTACDHDMSVDGAAKLLWDEVGLSGLEMERLKLHVYSFLAICIAPPKAREKKAKEAGELIGKLKTLGASRGPDTDDSASASSAGDPPTSGPQIPGA